MRKPAVWSTIVMIGIIAVMGLLVWADSDDYVIGTITQVQHDWNGNGTFICLDNGERYGVQHVANAQLGKNIDVADFQMGHRIKVWYKGRIWGETQYYTDIITNVDGTREVREGIKITHKITKWKMLD